MFAIIFFVILCFITNTYMYVYLLTYIITAILENNNSHLFTIILYNTVAPEKDSAPLDIYNCKIPFHHREVISHHVIFISVYPVELELMIILCNHHGSPYIFLITSTPLDKTEVSVTP